MGVIYVWVIFSQALRCGDNGKVTPWVSSMCGFFSQALRCGDYEKVPPWVSSMCVLFFTGVTLLGLCKGNAMDVIYVCVIFHRRYPVGTMER